MKPIFIGRRRASDPQLDSLAFDHTARPEDFPFEPVGIITSNGRFKSLPEAALSADELREIATRMDRVKRKRAGG